MIEWPKVSSFVLITIKFGRYGNNSDVGVELRITTSK